MEEQEGEMALTHANQLLTYRGPGKNVQGWVVRDQNLRGDGVEIEREGRMRGRR